MALRARKRFLLLCLVSFAVLFILYPSAEQHKSETFIHENVSQFNFPPDIRRTGVPDRCTLPSLSPWNKEILEYVNLDFHQKHDWKHYVRTELDDGYIVRSKQSWKRWLWNCQGRCVYRHTEFDNKYSEWQPEAKKLNCDLVHVKCNSIDFSQWNPFRSYEMVHTQIVPVVNNQCQTSVQCAQYQMVPQFTQLKRTHPVSTNHNHSVYIIVIDSTGHSQARRNLARTLLYLKEDLGAVSFPFVNKLGMNSIPNGFPLLFGKSVEGFDGEQPDFPNHCRRYLDDLRVIFDDFREMGFRTLYAEDWFMPFYTYPNCNGFKRSIADHILSPLMRLTHGSETSLGDLYDSDAFKNAKTTVELLEYMDQYLKSYPEEAKMGLIWSTDMSHDWQSQSMGLDMMLLQLFADNREELDNSFVFFMGDHGLRWGREKYTKSHMLDINNPVLSISVPRTLRKTGMIEILQQNTNALQTHYDTRATWLDILKHQRLGNKVNSTHLKIPGEKGESYFRQQTGNRTCKSLRIPPVYCICEKDLEELPTDSPEAVRLGKRVIAEVNNYWIVADGFTDICGKWEFSRVDSLKALKPAAETGIYYITVATGAPYPDALFQTMITVSKNGSTEISTIDRRDSYGHNGDCVGSNSRPYCHCKDTGIINKFWKLLGR